ncbi:checkpoint protein HUS1-like [Anneissia japonica]|uniref:checkpoint protein HUS1-like n=1 Tax=Anneissia japonica TaxID=1529436 RepID=UPI001425B418|nr:checkpoint protein HUS1-like [Anneissia japonica]
MKFRAKVVDVACIDRFIRVLTTIAKMTQLCVLRITEDKMFFILNDNISKGNIWCEVTASNFFDEFNMEGLASDANEIYLEVTPDDLVRAAKTAQFAKTLKIKLTKKFSPCLTFFVELCSVSGHSRNVNHDVPVNIIPKRLWDEFQEPTIPDFDVSICMPSLKFLKNVVERMKNIGSYLELSANQKGDMTLKVESQMATVSTHFKSLEVQYYDDQQSSPKEKDQSFGAKIDIKKFQMFLTGLQLNPQKIICNIVDNRLVHFFLLQEELSLQYSMPIIQH